MGSLQTLPLEDIGSVTEAAKLFYNTYYTSDRMNLMLVCNKSLDELGNLAKKYFGVYK